MSDKHTVEFEKAFCDNESGKAIHVLLEDGTALWLPKSIVHDDSEVYQKGDEGTLVLPEWFAIKEGLV